MSFTDNQKIVGWAFFIAGILLIISALLYIYDGATAGDGFEIWTVVAGIGSLIAAVLYFLFGNKVRKSEITGKPNILGQYVRVVGINTIIIGVFGLGIDIGGGIVDIILGLVILWIAGKIADGKTTTADKIIWILLLIIFVVLFICAFIDIFTVGSIIGIIASICSAIIYLFMAAYLLDNDVKKAMGM